MPSAAALAGRLPGTAVVIDVVGVLAAFLLTVAGVIALALWLGRGRQGGSTEPREEGVESPGDAPTREADDGRLRPKPPADPADGDPTLPGS